MTPEEWYKGLPPVTRIYWTAVVGLTLLTTLKVVGYATLVLSFEQVFSRFEIWRLVTNFLFIGPFSMSFIFQIVLLVRYSEMLENKFGRHVDGTADYLTMLLFGMVLILFIAWGLLGPGFYSSSLVFMLVYVWSRSDPFAETLFYGFTFKQWHIPFVLLVFGMLLGADPMRDLLGIAVGHAYYFVSDIVPRNWGRQLLPTPQFMRDAVKAVHARWAGAGAGVGAQPASNSAAARPNWQQGQGYRLG